MGSLSDYAENALLSHLFNVSYTPPAIVYVALAVTDPTDTATGASMGEIVNSNGYARTGVSFSTATSRQVIQSGSVTFPQATGPWSGISYWGLVDTASYGAGNVLAHGGFTASFAPVSGNTVTIPTSNIVVQFSATPSGAGFTNYTVHKWLDRMFANQAFSTPLTYVALATATLADGTLSYASATEVVSNNYARKLVNPNGGASPTWTLASGGVVSNNDTITFATPNGTWGQITSVFIIDSTTSTGNILGYDNDNVVDQTPVANDTVQFSAGAFKATLT